MQCSPVLALLLVAAPALASPTLETIASFNPAALETPESVIIDFSGNKYVSLALTGEIRRIARDGTASSFAFLPLGGPPLTNCGSFINIMGALTFDLFGNIYATVASCDPAARGVWRVTPSGQKSLVANLPPAALPNGIDYVRGYLYVADSALGLIWRMPSWGGAAEVFVDSPLLKARPGAQFPGPNGIRHFRGQLYVAVSDTALIVKIPLARNGSAGTVAVHAQLDVGCDDFSFDIFANMYCTTDPFNTVVRVFPDGGSEVLFDVNDGLDGPTATDFSLSEPGYLFITNAAFPFFPNQGTPSLQRVFIGVPGAL